jgi:taurine dioxygenase
MSITTSTTFDITPAAGHIGAEVTGVDLTQPLDSEIVNEIKAALLQWKVLFFRDQDVTPEQQIAFAQHWGEITPAHPVLGSREGHPEIFRLEAKELRAAGAELRAPERVPARDSANGWHTDITFVANPAKLSVLKGVVIPEYGGDTLWTNLVAAYAGLSGPVKALLDGLQAVHGWNTYTGAADARDGKPRPAAIHPVVRVHPETGERALFVNPLFTTHIYGVTARESIELLDLLYEQLKRPEYTVRFRWQPNSIAMWDNRATAHLGPVDGEFVDLVRVVERVTVTGDLPVGPDGFTSRSLEGDLFG